VVAVTVAVAVAVIHQAVLLARPEPVAIPAVVVPVHHPAEAVPAQAVVVEDK
jgi:hypothetical protein